MSVCWFLHSSTVLSSCSSDWYVDACASKFVRKIRGTWVRGRTKRIGTLSHRLPLDVDLILIETNGLLNYSSVSDKTWSNHHTQSRGGSLIGSKVMGVWGLWWWREVELDWSFPADFNVKLQFFEADSFRLPIQFSWSLIRLFRTPFKYSGISFKSSRICGESDASFQMNRVFP